MFSTNKNRKNVVGKKSKDRRQGGLVQRGENNEQGNVHYQGEGGGVDVVAEEHGDGGFREAMLGEE
jgi:hypothetical protein